MNWLKIKFYKLTHWEFWNTWLIYLPMAPVWLYFSFKNRKWFFFENVNPGIKFGGMAMQSKIETYSKLPDWTIPKTTLVKNNSNFNVAAKSLHGFKFPVIVKPDAGLKGLGVDVIHNINGLKEYHVNMPYDYLIQEKIPFLNEIGVFYCRYPQQSDGFITGITNKRHLKIIGDGVSTIEILLSQDKKLRLQLPYLKKHKKELLAKIPNTNEEIVLLEIGSHTRGATFQEVTNDLYTQVYNLINPIAKNIEGFYYGRFDILYQTDEKNKTITKFKIIELNGAMSEPIHIYSPNKSILSAWKEIIKHWSIMSKIALQNGATKHKTSFLEGLQIIVQSLKLEKLLKKQLYHLKHHN